MNSCFDARAVLAKVSFPRAVTAMNSFAALNYGYLHVSFPRAVTAMNSDTLYLLMQYRFHSPVPLRP